MIGVGDVFGSRMRRSLALMLEQTRLKEKMVKQRVVWNLGAEQPLRWCRSFFELPRIQHLQLKLGGSPGDFGLNSQLTTPTHLQSNNLL